MHRIGYPRHAGCVRTRRATGPDPVIADVVPQTRNMKTLLRTLVAAIGVIAAQSQTNPPAVGLATIAVAGTNFNSDAILTVFTPVATDATRMYLPGYSIFSVALSHDLSHPAGTACVLIRSNDIATCIGDIEDAARFLTAKHLQVRTDSEADAVFSLLGELFSYSVITNPPPRPGDSTSPTPPKDERAVWATTLTRTPMGWCSERTLLVNPRIGLSFRVAYSVTEGGDVSARYVQKMSQYGYYQ